jgi:putative zinc finger protein
VDEMMQHTELEQLSAYIDGELTAAERAGLEAHLPGCDECRASLDALRMTLADLRTLPEETPSEQDSWALRTAIARARKPSKRWQRYVVAAGSVAAVAIAFVAFVNRPGSEQNLTANAPDAGPRLIAVNENFDSVSAQSHLLVLVGKVSSPEAVQAPVLTDQKETFGPTAGGAGAVRREAVTADDSYSDSLERCVQAVRASTQNYLEPFRYELARFEEKPAYFLVFRVEERYELWVMSADGNKPCETLFFSQTS